MSTTWMIVVLVGAATVALKGLAPVLLGERELPAPVTRVSGALAPALLAALVVVQTAGDGQALAVDPARRRRRRRGGRPAPAGAAAGRAGVVGRRCGGGQRAHLTAARAAAFTARVSVSMS